MIRNLVATGVRSADDPRAELWQAFMTVVEQLRPRAVLVENVPDLPSWDDGSVLMGFYESLRELGYTRRCAGPRCLPVRRAAAPSAPDPRRHSATRGEFEWPEPRGRDHDAPRRDRRPAAGSARRSGPSGIPYFGPPHTPSSGGCETALPPRIAAVVHDHITRDVRPDDAEAFALLGEGQTYIDLPSICGATAATSSPTSTSGSPGTRSAGPSPRTSPRTATGTSTRAAPDAVRSRGRAHADVPRLVPLRRPADAAG